MPAAPSFWGEPPRVLANLLMPIGAVWDAAGRWREAMADPYRSPVPVVCVGNLVAGGAGKTPVTMALATLLAAHGVAPHIVARGYGGRLVGPVRVDPARHDADAVGDEALLLASRAPAWVARDRAAGVRAAAAAGAPMILLDDGLQNPTIGKDLSLVVVDAAYGFGNGRVIPAGPLRERLARGLARADAVILLGAGADAGCLDRHTAREVPVLHASVTPIAGDRLTGVAPARFCRDRPSGEVLRDVAVARRRARRRPAVSGPSSLPRQRDRPAASRRRAGAGPARHDRQGHRARAAGATVRHRGARDRNSLARRWRARSAGPAPHALDL